MSQSTSLAIVQYDISTDQFLMRIGADVIELPQELTERINQAINSVSAFNTQHAVIAHEIWSGKLEYEPDEFQT